MIQTRSCVFVKQWGLRLCGGVRNNLSILFKIQPKVLSFVGIPMRLVMQSSELVSVKKSLWNTSEETWAAFSGHDWRCFCEEKTKKRESQGSTIPHWNNIKTRENKWRIIQTTTTAIWTEHCLEQFWSGDVVFDVVVENRSVLSVYKSVFLSTYSQTSAPRRKTEAAEYEMALQSQVWQFCQITAQHSESRPCHFDNAM